MANDDSPTDGSSGEIVCLLDKKTGMQVMGDGIDQLIANVFNEVHFLNILRPIHAVERLQLNQHFDLSCQLRGRSRARRPSIF